MQRKTINENLATEEMTQRKNTKLIVVGSGLGEYGCVNTRTHIHIDDIVHI